MDKTKRVKMTFAAKQPSNRPSIIFIAGFGGHSSMYKKLENTVLGARYDLILLNLPGFGAPTLTEKTTLNSMADCVAKKAREIGAQIVVAHSVASIIASLAARMPDCPLSTILSLEGNITPEDAYFSGTAANYADPIIFKTDFLKRLDEMASSNSIIKKYRQEIEEADPIALWQLGRDAADFSSKYVPGEILASAADVIYFYNPENCPDSTLKWLQENPMKRVVLNSTSHWPSIDQPDLLANEIIRIIS